MIGDDTRLRGWLAPQMLLGIAGLLTFVLIPIQFNTVYEGLPAHPLFVHVPVILIPTVAFAVVVICARPKWFAVHSLWICALAVIALGALNLTMNAGDALRGDIESTFSSTVVNLINRHAHAAGILRIFMIALTAALIVAVALDRQNRGASTGIGWIDAIVRPLAVLLRDMLAVRVLLAALALGCLYFVFLTGDLGARAVWQGRVQQAAGAPGYGHPPRFGKP
jgi:hypothetical protein